jgi:hypothetical protein
MSAALELGQRVGQAVACRALGVPRASLYRSMQPAAPHRARPTPERALDAAERQTVLDHLHSLRFCDKAPSEVYATLLNEGIYLCSIRTMHRILARNGGVEGAPQPASSPAGQEAGTAGHGAKSGVELGHREVTRAGQVDLLPLIRHPGHLQPLRGGLDVGRTRNRRVGKAADRRHMRQTRHRCRRSDHPRRPRDLDDFAAGGSLDGGSGRG